jgi:ABC-type lipoprotein export system ATPase subunit
VPPETVLSARGLTKRFTAPDAGAIDVLSGVDLSVRRGELIAVEGASGSGKSTLLNVLGLLEDPDGGEVSFGDRRVSALSRSAKSRERGRWVGFVFQAFLLLPGLSALDNVLLAARYTGGVTAEHRRRALMLLERLGVAHRRDHRPAQLSGGEQQRVAFCRAVLNDPPLLLADEPTGNLDDANGAVILTGLREQVRAGGAVVVVSHRPEAARDATAVFTLAAGQLQRAQVGKVQGGGST